MSKKNFCLGLVILVILILFTYVYTANFASFSADDFSYYIKYKACLIDNNYNTLSSIINCSNNVYMKWQGTYFVNFIVYVFMSLSSLGIKGVHIFLQFNILLFFISTIYIIKTIINKFDINLILFLFIIVFIGSNTVSPNEAFYWLLGALNYTLPLSISLFAISFYIQFLRSEKYTYLILSSVLSILSAGSTLMVVGFINSVYLLLVLIYIYNKKFNFIKGLPFLLTFIGSLINALAPGNFIRNLEISSDGIHLKEAIISTFINIFKNINFVISNTYFILLLIILALLVYFEKIKIKKVINPIFLGFYYIFIMFCSYFPFILGYNSPASEPTRVLFTISYINAICISFVFLFIIQYICDRKYSIIFKRIFSMSLTLMFIFSLFKINDLILFKMGKEILNGNLKSFYNNQTSIIEYIKNSEDDEVVVKTIRVYSDVLNNSGLTEDKEFWTNKSVSQIFNKKSVSIKYE